MKKYLNLFWVILAVLVLSNEFFIGGFKLADLSEKTTVGWLLIAVWVIIAARNLFSFFFTIFRRLRVA